MKKLLAILKFLGKSALKNAMSNPRTTTAGVAAIISGVEILNLPNAKTDDIALGVTTLVGGIAFVLADDPNKKPNDEN
jgi:hypothetical protein